MEYLGEYPGYVTYALNEPIDVKVEQIDGGYVGEYAKLGLIASGKSIEELDIDMNKEFVFLYEKLVNTDDKFLSNRMKVIKYELKAIVKNRSIKWD